MITLVVGIILAVNLGEDNEKPVVAFLIAIIF